MAVDGEDGFVGVGDARPQAFYQLSEGLRQGVADCVGDVDGFCAFVNGGFDDAAEKVFFRAAGVFGGEFDIVGVLAGEFDRGLGGGEHFVRGHAQLFFHVDGGGGDEDMQAFAGGRFEGVAGGFDVFVVGAGEGADDAVADGFGNAADGEKVAVAGDGEAGFDDIDAQAFEL